MLRRYHIGTAPSDEACAQTGITEDWLRLQHLECLVYRAALIARFGPEPGITRMKPALNTHDFGCYYDLVVAFDEEDPAELTYAEQVASGLARWRDGGFLAPVSYNEASQPRPQSETGVRDSIVSVLLVGSQLIRDGFGTDDDRTRVAHLRRAFPAAAARADRRLAEIPPLRPITP